MRSRVTGTTFATPDHSISAVWINAKFISDIGQAWNGPIYSGCKWPCESGVFALATEAAKNQDRTPLKLSLSYRCIWRNYNFQTTINAAKKVAKHDGAR